MKLVSSNNGDFSEMGLPAEKRDSLEIDFYHYGN